VLSAGWHNCAGPGVERGSWQLLSHGNDRPRYRFHCNGCRIVAGLSQRCGRDDGHAARLAGDSNRRTLPVENIHDLIAEASRRAAKAPAWRIMVRAVA